MFPAVLGKILDMRPHSVPLPEALGQEVRAQDRWDSRFPQQVCPRRLTEKGREALTSLKTFLSGPARHDA